MKKIVFIEDETTLQKMLSVALEEAGYSVITAADGETGLAAVRSEIPDLVLLDLILPKMDGFTVLNEIKKDETTTGIPVIVLTNLESAEDVGKVVALGATTYLVKANYDLPDIVEKIKEILGV
ncbi:MAG: response regulator [Candidatus Azambacteria bacterium]|nr:response regulator [Candidatus Azambacteria bacterium]